MAKNPIIAIKAPSKVLITFVISFVSKVYFPVCKLAPMKDSIKHAKNAATVKIIYEKESEDERAKYNKKE